MTKKDKYNPEKTFAEDLAKLNPMSEFAGQEILHFNSLYGKLTAPESNYVFASNYGSGPENFPYLIGEDERKAGEIWNDIKPTVEKKAMSMIRAGKGNECDVLIAKKLILPDRFCEEVEQYKNDRANEVQTESIDEQIISGSLFRELKETNGFYRSLIRILKKDGAKLGNETIIGISLGYGKEHESLLNLALHILEKKGYQKELMQKLSYGLWYEKEGYARADMYELCNNGEKFVGEVKFILSEFPCGKNYLQKNIEFAEYYKTKPKKDMSCGFIKSMESCAPGWCFNEQRK